MATKDYGYIGIPGRGRRFLGSPEKPNLSLKEQMELLRKRNQSGLEQVNPPIALEEVLNLKREALNNKGFSTSNIPALDKAYPQPTLPVVKPTTPKPTFNTDQLKQEYINSMLPTPMPLPFQAGSHPSRMVPGSDMVVYGRPMQALKNEMPSNSLSYHSPMPVSSIPNGYRSTLPINAPGAGSGGKAGGSKNIRRPYGQMRGY